MRIRLSSNESPFGPSPAAIAAATDAAVEAHRYPDDASVALRTALAQADGLPIEAVMVGTGSAAVLMDLVAACCAGHPDAEVVTYARAFVVYRLATATAGARLVEVPVGPGATGHDDGYARDPEALLEAVTPRTRVVVLDNPANPTGAHLDADGIRVLAAGLPEHVTLVIDEAYHHFATGRAGYARVADLDLDLDHPRVAVVTTFSKAHALAGHRVGVLTGPVELVATVDGRRPRFNLAAPAQAAALAALADTDHLAATVAGTCAGRDRLAAGLRALGVPLTAGLGNFVTVELGSPAGAVVAAYAQRGIGVRALAPYGLDEQVRITVGTPEEVGAVLAASAEVLARVPSRR
jgi:histidinol-phosphate aminotransferase